SAFYAVYAVQEFGIEGRQIGVLTGIMIGTQAATNVIWGRLADRAGNKIVLVAGAAVTACACGSAWFATSPVGMWVTFALIGVATAAEMVGGMNITLEFGEPEKRPTYVGLTHTLLAPAASLAPVIGGWLAVLLNFRVVFATSALLSILGGLVLAVWVSDPRRKLGA
ncbi:MAG: MFS transporter, partial [Anaerolineae bacterium]|nr:MFS transporter [Anaerolineae bacterium]